MACRPRSLAKSLSVLTKTIQEDALSDSNRKYVSLVLGLSHTCGASDRMNVVSKFAVNPTYITVLAELPARVLPSMQI